MNIILCGFMGSGKTRIGKLLSKETGREFVDMDKYIENNMGMKIVDIFERYGEDKFRELEHDAVKELSKKKNLIIASGGGTVLREENVVAFHKGGGFIIFLNVPVVVLEDRLKNDKKRPLLQQPNRNEVIEKLYAERYHLYKAASDATVYSGARASLVVKRISSIMKKLQA